MGNYLTRLVDRTLGAVPGVEPLIPSVYANAPVSGGCDLLKSSPDPEKSASLGDGPETNIISDVAKEISRTVPMPSHTIIKDQMPYSHPAGLSAPYDLAGDGNGTVQFHAEEKSPGQIGIPLQDNLHTDPTDMDVLPPEKDNRSAHNGHDPANEQVQGLMSFSPVTAGISPTTNVELVGHYPEQPNGSERLPGENPEWKGRRVQPPSGRPVEQAPLEELLVPDSNYRPEAPPQLAGTRVSGLDASPVPASQSRPNAQTTRVTIGRIEVRAIMRPAPGAPAAETARKQSGPALSLEDYLKQRNGNSL